MRTQGCKFDPFDERDKLFRARRIKLPNRVDNREYITPVKNQGAEGSCVGFAVTKAVEMAYWRKTLKQRNLSERWAYQYAKKYDEWPGDNYEGSSIRGGLKALNKVGVCAEALWRYRAGRKGRAKKGAGKNAKNFKISKYTRVNGINNIKAAIFSKGLVVVAAEVHSGWNKPPSVVIRCGPRSTRWGGHAFLMVGYKNNGFWVVNSWGNRWGLRGFAVLPYRDARLHIMDAWTIQI